jgi:hypothetical protein
MRGHHALAAYIMLAVFVAFAVAAIEKATVAALFHLPDLHVGGLQP